MHAPGLRSILSSDNSNSATDIDESSIRTGIINQAATYVRRLLPSSNEKSGYWLTPSSRVIFFSCCDYVTFRRSKCILEHKLIIFTMILL